MINSDPTFDDVKYAYRKLALELHPDKNIQESNGEKFKNITEAYHFLKNNHKKITAMKRKTSRNHTKENIKEESNFKKTDSRWGANFGRNPPEEDWGKFTKEADKDFWKQYEKEFWKDYNAKSDQKPNEEQFNRPNENTVKEDWQVSVDPSLCIGCCSCETIAPGVFKVDKLSKMNPKSHVYNREGERHEKIMDAAQTCPTKAIEVDDNDTKRRLYPW